MNSTFYLHTQPEFFPGFHFEDRATIACRRNGDHIEYGISICCAGDNFNRAKGRELAEDRMNRSFGKCKFNNGYYDTFQSEEDAMLDFAKGLALAIQRNFPKYKKKINIFNGGEKVTVNS
jgi:hypothetical protein